MKRQGCDSCVVPPCHARSVLWKPLFAVFLQNVTICLTPSIPNAIPTAPGLDPMVPCSYREMESLLGPVAFARAAQIHLALAVPDPGLVDQLGGKKVGVELAAAPELARLA
jgi:hypothetical protein